MRIFGIFRHSPAKLGFQRCARRDVEKEGEIGEERQRQGYGGERKGGKIERMRKREIRSSGVDRHDDDATARRPQDAHDERQARTVQGEPALLTLFHLFSMKSAATK